MLNWFKFGITLVSRVVIHPANFTALGAFASTSTGSLPTAVVSTLFTAWFTDVVVNLLYYPEYFTVFGNLWVYFSYMLITVLSRYTSTILLPVMSSLVFFLVSNFGVFASGGYTYTLEGLLACYTLALPFYTNTLLGDIVYTSILLNFNTKTHEVTF